MSDQNFIQLSAEQFETMMSVVKGKTTAEIGHHTMSVVAIVLSVIAILLHVLPVLAK